MPEPPAGSFRPGNGRNSDAQQGDGRARGKRAARTTWKRAARAAGGRPGAGQRDGRHGQQGDGRGQQGAGRHGLHKNEQARTAKGRTRTTEGGMETGGKSKPLHRKQKARSAEAERVIGTVAPPGGRSGGTERQPFLIEAISWAGVACR